jgi:hypothetical protein
MNLFSTVKTSINTREAAERYGIDVNRTGKALCPFHNDRNPSMNVYDDHYHCFACGEHGDVINLVARLYDLPMYEAAQKLAYDFGISQNKTPTKEMEEKLNKKTEAQQLKENEKLCFLHLNGYCRFLREWKVVYAPKTPEETWHPRFVEACDRLEYVEYLVDLLIAGDSYDRTDIIRMMYTDNNLSRLQAHLKKAQKEEKSIGKQEI